MDRAQLFDTLSNLPSAAFERLLIAVNMPRMNRTGAAATVGEQVSALLAWAESSIGPGVEVIENYLDKLESDSLPLAFDFSKYLQSICRDQRYQDARGELYTETDVLILLEVETVEQQTPSASGMRTAEAKPPKEKRFPVLEGLQKYAIGDERQHLLLAGRPGSGKSTALKRLLLKTAEAALEQPEIIPVYVQLKGDSPITDLIIAEFRRAKVRVTPEQLDEWLLQDCLLLLLDGVNEIPSDQQRRQLQTFREDNPTTPMIFTTRDLAAGGDLGIQKHLEMRPLSESQMREFVQKYLPHHANTLLRQLKDRLREVAETPLLLKMLCAVFSDTWQIPQSKGELFRLFNAKYDEFKGLVAVSDDSRRFKPELLQHLAFCMLQGDPAKPTEAWLTLDRNRAERLLEAYLTGRIEAPGQRAKEWLEDLLEHHLLQVATDPRKIEFHHQLFQEYYAAEALLLKLPDLLEDEAKFKRDYLNLLKWTEPIALMLALLENEAQALRVVKLAMDDVDLMLGARLAGSIKVSLQAETICWIDTLDIPTRLKFDCWAASHSESAISTLRQALEDQDSSVRRSAANALGKLGGESAIHALCQALEDSDDCVRRRAAYLLGKLGSESAIPALRQAMEDPDSEVGRRAAEALGRLGSESAISVLRQALENQNSDVHSIAADALGTLGAAATISVLRQALEDPESNVRKDLEDPDPKVRRSAAYLLGKLGGKVVILALRQALEDSDSDVRWSAAEALGKLGDKAAIPTLRQALESPNLYIRMRATEVLGKLGGEAAILALRQALEDPTSDVRWRAAEALGKLGDEAAIYALCQTLEDPDPKVRRRAAYVLGKLGGKVVISALRQALEDPDSEVRRRAAYGLGELGDEAAIPTLRQDLEEDSDIRWSATQALAKLGNAATIIDLWNVYLRQPELYIEEAISAIQKRCKFYNYEIWQASLADQQDDSTPTQSDKTIASTITIQTVENLTIMSDESPIFNQQHATIGVNYAAEGSQQDFTQHIHAPEQNFEILLTSYKHFIDELQQQNPHVTDETAIIQTIDIEARRIDTRWQNFLNLKRLWNGGKKAAIKVGEHFVESNPWGKGAIAFLEGVSEDVK